MTAMRYRWKCRICGARSVKRGCDEGSHCDRCACDDWVRLRRRRPDPKPAGAEGDEVADEADDGADGVRPRDWFLTACGLVMFVLAARGLAAFCGW